MDSLTLIIQVLGIVALIALIVLLAIGIYIFLTIAKHLKDIVELLKVLSAINAKYQEVQLALSPKIQSIIEKGSQLAMNLLTTARKRK